MHLVQTICPEHNEPAVFVPAEIREVFQQPVCELLVASGTGAPGFGQHGVVGPVVANALLTEHVLVGGARGVAPAPLLPAGKFALGIRQLQKHRPCRKHTALQAEAHLPPCCREPEFHLIAFQQEKMGYMFPLWLLGATSS